MYFVAECTETMESLGNYTSRNQLYLDSYFAPVYSGAYLVRDTKFHKKANGDIVFSVEPVMRILSEDVHAYERVSKLLVRKKIIVESEAMSLMFAFLSGSLADKPLSVVLAHKGFSVDKPLEIFDEILTCKTVGTRPEIRFSSADIKWLVATYLDFSDKDYAAVTARVNKIVGLLAYNMTMHAYIKTLCPVSQPYLIRTELRSSFEIKELKESWIACESLSGASKHYKAIEVFGRQRSSCLNYALTTHKENKDLRVEAIKLFSCPSMFDLNYLTVPQYDRLLRE